MVTPSDLFHGFSGRSRLELDQDSFLGIGGFIGLALLSGPKAGIRAAFRARGFSATALLKQPPQQIATINNAAAAFKKEALLQKFTAILRKKKTPRFERPMGSLQVIFHPFKQFTQGELFIELTAGLSMEFLATVSFKSGRHLHFRRITRATDPIWLSHASSGCRLS